MGQGDQLNARGRNGDRPVAQQAVQEVSHVVLCAVRAVDVQRLEHCVRQTLQHALLQPRSSSEGDREVSLLKPSTAKTAQSYLKSLDAMEAVIRAMSTLGLACFRPEFLKSQHTYHRLL